MEGYFKREIQLQSVNIGDNQDDIVTIWQLYESEVGGVVWDSALLMSHYLDWNNKRKLTIKDKKIIELGAGTGVVGITAASLGAHVIITDLSNQLELMQMNVKQNEELIRSKGGSVIAEEWKWNCFVACKDHMDGDCDDEQLFGIKLSSIDYVFVCDCLYYEESIHDLVNSIEKFINHGSIVLLAYEDRESKEEIVKKFFKLLSSIPEITFEKVPQTHLHPDYSSPDLHLIEITKKVVILNKHD